MNSYQMKEILLITRPITPPWDEGSKNIAWQIAKSDQDHHFHILSIKNPHLPPNNGNITIRDIYSSDQLNTAQKLRLFWFLLSTINPAVEIYHTIFVPTPLTSLIVSAITKIHNKRYIQTVPCLYKETNSRKKNLYLSPDRIVALSDWTKQKLIERGLHPIERINAGVNTQKHKPVHEKKGYRLKLGLPVNRPLVLYSGELTRLDALPKMVSIVKKVLSHTKDLSFVFASPTRSRKDAYAREKAIKHIRSLGYSEYVCFLGDVDNFEVVLKACDMLVYPVSDMEGKIDTPLTVLEAMATGIPVIYSDIPPLNEVGKDEIGIAVNPEDVRGFSEAIFGLTKDMEHTREMGELGRKVVLEHYNEEKMVQQYRDLYNEFIG